MKIFFLTLFLFQGTLGAFAVRVVTSILPLYFLTKDIVAEGDQVDVLLSPETSPHHYTMRPSDLEKIDGADIFFWIGPELETFLADTLSRFPDKSYPLLKSVLLSGYPQRTSCHHHQKGHHHFSIRDPHIWLSPRHTIFLVDAIRTVLTKHQPVKKDIYQNNADQLINKLQSLDGKILKLLRPYKNVPFFVCHDGYQYFERSYGLNHQGVIFKDHQLSARHFKDLKQQITKKKIGTFFSEKQFPKDLVQALAGNRRIVDLNPLGTVLPGDDQENGYIVMMWTLAKDFEKGLKHP